MVAPAHGGCCPLRADADCLCPGRRRWHTGAQVTIPEGIHLVFLSSYSPELQPAEHLWPLTNEPLANQRFASLAELGKVQAERYLVLQQQPNLIRQHTLFHWWPTDA